MKKTSILLTLMSFTLSSQPVCATDPCPMVGCGAEYMRALGAKATAELLASGYQSHQHYLDSKKSNGVKPSAMPEKPEPLLINNLPSAKDRALETKD